MLASDPKGPSLSGESCESEALSLPEGSLLGSSESL
jgi:hypothetical protein